MAEPGQARRVAVASQNGATVHQHFGHATHFRIYDLRPDGAELVEVRENVPSCGPGEENAHAHLRALDLVRDCTALVVSCIGPGALRHVKARGIACYQTEALIEDILRQLAAETRKGEAIG